MVKKRRVSKKKIRKFMIFLILIVGIIIALVLFLNKPKEQNIVKIKSVDKIEGYDYSLSSNATKYHKSLFKQLKEVLENDEIDEAKYADLVTKLFVSDFYNLDNKTNKNDIGGVQYVYKDYREDFRKLATDTIYKSVENNLYGNRKQDLPVVTNVSTEKSQDKAFTYKDKTDEKAYNINFGIEYEKDLDYQKEGTVTLIHNDKKLEVSALE